MESCPEGLTFYINIQMHVYVQKKMHQWKNRVWSQKLKQGNQYFPRAKDIILLKKLGSLGNGASPQRKGPCGTANVNPTQELHNEAQDPGSNSSPQNLQEEHKATSSLGYRCRRGKHHSYIPDIHSTQVLGTGVPQNLLSNTLNLARLWR